MRLVSFLVAALLATAACKSSSDQPAARKLRKMDFRTLIDERGRLRLTLSMFDTRHQPMPVAGSYAVEVTKPDGSLLCKAAGELAPADFSEKGVHNASWHDASCPADPGADELKVNVKVTVPGGAAAGKDDSAKDAKDAKDAGKDMVFDRSVTLPIRSVYDRVPQKKPVEAKPADGSGSGSAAKPADGSAAKPAEKPAETKPAQTPAEKPADGSAAKPAEKPAEKPAASSAH